MMMMCSLALSFWNVQNWSRNLKLVCFINGRLRSLIRNDYIGENRKNFSFIAAKFLVLSLAYLAIQSSFIHAPYFPQWKSWKQAQEWKRREKLLRTKQLAFRFCPIFQLGLFRLTRAHIFGTYPFASLPRASFMFCCFSFSFSKPQFSLRKFLFHFLDFHSWTTFRVEGAFTHRNFHIFFTHFNNTKTFHDIFILFLRISLDFTFLSHHFVFRLSLSSLFMHHSLFVGKCQRRLFHTSTLSRSLQRDFPEHENSEKKKHFHSINWNFVVFMPVVYVWAWVCVLLTFISLLPWTIFSLNDNILWG